MAEFGGLDVVVLNAAYQKNRESLESLPTEEFDRVFKTNLYSLLWTARAAVPHLKAGASIITTASIQAFNPSPELIDYAMTKAAQVAFTKALAQELGPKGIRVNAVAPGPIWTPLIPATEWPDKLPTFGQDTPLQRAGQPAELAPAYVLLASDQGSYISAPCCRSPAARASDEAFAPDSSIHIHNRRNHESGQPAHGAGEEAGGYGTPTAEQEMPAADNKQFAQPRDEEDFDAAGLNQTARTAKRSPRAPPTSATLMKRTRTAPASPGRAGSAVRTNK